MPTAPRGKNRKRSNAHSCSSGSASNACRNIWRTCVRTPRSTTAANRSNSKTGRQRADARPATKKTARRSSARGFFVCLTSDVDQPLRFRPCVLGPRLRIGRPEPLAFIARRDLLRDRRLHVGHALLELANPLAHRARDLRNALRTEEQQHDEYDDEDLAEPEISKAHGDAP